jgi:hypothetical protein
LNNLHYVWIDNEKRFPKIKSLIDVKNAVLIDFLNKKCSTSFISFEFSLKKKNGVVFDWGTIKQHMQKTKKTLLSCNENNYHSFGRFYFRGTVQRTRR